VIDNVGALVLRQLVTWCLATALVVFLPRYLGDEGFGKTTFVIGLMTALLVVTNLGTNTFIVKRISVDAGAWSPLFWNACVVRLAVALPITALALVTLPAAGVEPEMRALLLITSATLVVASLEKSAEAAVQGLEQMRWLSLAEIANKAVVTVAGIAVLLAGYSVVTFGAVILGGWLASLAVVMFALVRLGLQRPRVSAPGCRLLVLGGLPFLISSAISQAYQWTDVAVLQTLTRAAVVGWYGVALQLYATLNFLPLILATALLPPLSRLFHAGDRDAFLKLSRQGLVFVLLISLPMAAGLALVAGDLIAFLSYPPEFDRSVPVLAVLALSLPLTGALMVTSTTMFAMDRQAQWVKVMAVSLALNVVLNAVLIEALDRGGGNGAIGAAAASAIAEAFQLALGARLLPEGLLDRDVIGQTLRSLAATGAMALVVVAAQSAGLHLLVTVALGAATYGAGLLLLGALRTGDVAALLRAWSATRSPAVSIEGATR
jgi:O-antigen/teichoic acid export membrane protein